MAATTVDRQTERKQVERIVAEDATLAASTTIPNGVMVGRNAAGDLVNAADVAGITVIGFSDQRMVNATGGAAKVKPPARVRKGVAKFGTTGANAVTKADLNQNVFVLDNQTVVKTAGTSNAIVAGVLDAIDADGGCWVKFD